MIPMVPVAMSGVAAVHLVAGMVLALLAVPACAVFVMLMPVVPHGASLAGLMIRLVDFGFSSASLLMRNVVLGVMVVAFNHVRSLSVEVIVKYFRVRRAGRYPSSV